MSPEYPAGALTGIRVVEMGQLIAGPFCGQLLGDLGADVVKVEPPGVGDPMRLWGKTNAGGASLTWPVIARNKKSITLDLRLAAGQEVARRLLDRSDILVENFRPGTLERWGLSPERLWETNPGLIIVRVTGFGQTGPYAPRAGYGSIGEAMGGLRHLTGEADRPPSRAGVSMGDSLAGTYAALGAMAALNARTTTGRGQIVDSAIYEAVLAMMEASLTEWDAIGHQRERTGAVLPDIAPSNVYPTADASSILIAANQDTASGGSPASWGGPNSRRTTASPPTTPAGNASRSSTTSSPVGRPRTTPPTCSNCCPRVACRPGASTAPRTCSPTSTSPPATRSCGPATAVATSSPCRTSPRACRPPPAASGGADRNSESTTTTCSPVSATTPRGSSNCATTP
jgi:hypothetical protein